ncbi:MAG: amidohydrolase [Candidatus Fermentibacteraceae bacterium]
MGPFLRTLRKACGKGESLNTRELRRALHERAEVSGREAATAVIVADFIAATRPTRLLRGIAGHGVAALYQGALPGPRVMVRCELDGLPMPDGGGAYHGCGHDGHIAILAGVAAHLAEAPLEGGSVLLLFQPSEETGAGASAVLKDEGFRSVMPDFAMALHNLPGFALGEVILRHGVFASASAGITVHLTGERSHAGEPQKGRSPAMAVAQLIQALSALPQSRTGLFQPAKVTVVHAALGAETFGTSPGEAVVMATLRASEKEVLEELFRECRPLAEGIAGAYGLGVSVGRSEEFPPVFNDSRLVDIVAEAANGLGMNVSHRDEPFPWSEDFGRFTDAVPGVLFGLGAGEETPPLHHPDYDFPDGLLHLGSKLLLETVRSVISRGGLS